MIKYRTSIEYFGIFFLKQNLYMSIFFSASSRFDFLNYIEFATAHVVGLSVPKLKKVLLNVTMNCKPLKYGKQTEEWRMHTCT